MIAAGREPVRGVAREFLIQSIKVSHPLDEGRHRAQITRFPPPRRWRKGVPAEASAMTTRRSPARASPNARSRKKATRRKAASRPPIGKKKAELGRISTGAGRSSRPAVPVRARSEPRSAAAGSQPRSATAPSALKAPFTQLVAVLVTWKAATALERSGDPTAAAEAGTPPARPRRRARSDREAYPAGGQINALISSATKAIVPTAKRPTTSLKRYRSMNLDSAV